MIIMITRARVSGCFGSPVVAGAVLVLSAVASAALAGALAGLAGAVLDPPLRALLALAAVTTVLVGAAFRPVPWQLDRETDTRWLDHHDWRTAAYNGIALGLGFTTRIGFWLWYVVPLSAFVVADPMLAAAGYGVFALARVGLSVLLTSADVYIGGGIARARLVADPLAFAALGALYPVLAPLV